MDKQSPTIIAASIEALRSHKRLADGAIAQTSDNGLRKSLDANTNCIAVIMKHMAGNMISRWTDFLTTDGEKPSRDRDNEFVDDFADRAAVLARWEAGWARLFETMNELNDRDLFNTVTIRGEPHHVIDAIQRQVAHYGYHVGQIVLIARVLKGDGAWEVLTIPRGGSKRLNEAMNVPR